MSAALMWLAVHLHSGLSESALIRTGRASPTDIVSRLRLAAHLGGDLVVVAHAARNPRVLRSVYLLGVSPVAGLLGAVRGESPDSVRGALRALQGMGWATYLHTVRDALEIAEQIIGEYSAEYPERIHMIRVRLRRARDPYRFARRQLRAASSEQRARLEEVLGGKKELDRKCAAALVE